MKCLVVTAHPLQDSLCQYLATETVRHLKGKGYHVVEKNLYQEGFDPVLNEAERASYYEPAFEASSLQLDIDQLKEAESLVLVFPTWWFGFPAILKGWFDRVWAPGHAYDHASDLGSITPRLDNLKELKVITTLGSPWWVDALVLWQPVKRILKIALLGACAKNCEFKMLSLHKSESLTNAQVDRFVGKIRKTF